MPVSPGYQAGLEERLIDAIRHGGATSFVHRAFLVVCRFIVDLEVKETTEIDFDIFEVYLALHFKHLNGFTSRQYERGVEKRTTE